MFEITQHNTTFHIRMNYGRVNAMDLEFCQRLIDLFNGLEANPDCQAVTLSGNERVFSAGINLKHWLQQPADYVVPFIEAIENLFLRCFKFEKPLIALINGPAIAGGCMLANACDYRLITPSARIGIPESRVGVPLPITAVEIVRFVAAGPAFKRIIQLGAEFVGQQAVDVGLADSVTPAAEMPATAQKIIEEFLAMPTATFQFTKRQLRAPVVEQIARQRAALYDPFLAVWQSPEIRQSIADYVRDRLS